MRAERRAFLPFLFMTPVLFLSGAALAYYVAMPLALHYLLGYQGNIGGIQQEALPGVGNYLDFSTRFIFGFGVAFLLPVLLMLLERAGLVTRKQLVRGRRYAIVLVDRRRRGADAAGRDFDDAARRPAGAALRALAGRDLVHRAQAGEGSRPGGGIKSAATGAVLIRSTAMHTSSTALEADCRSCPAPRTVLQRRIIR